MSSSNDIGPIVQHIVTYSYLTPTSFINAFSNLKVVSMETRPAGAAQKKRDIVTAAMTHVVRYVLNMTQEYLVSIYFFKE